MPSHPTGYGARLRAGDAIYLGVPLPPLLCQEFLHVPLMLTYLAVQQEWRAKYHPRRIQPRIHEAPLSDVACIDAYRMDRGAVEELCLLLGPRLQSRVPTRRSIPVLQKVLIALHYLGTGSFQGDVARQHGTAQSSTSRCADAFLDAMLMHLPDFIAFPTAEAELRRLREEFCAVAGFPNVVSAIDSTLVGLAIPQNLAGSYRSRQHQTLNVQATCDARGLFTSVVAKFPGSVRDAQIFDASTLKATLASWPEGEGWILGDCGYPLRPYLLTPYPVESSEPVARYNLAHQQTRLVVERAFRMLKMRFRCLQPSGARLMRTLEKAAKVFVVCAMLHNMALRRNTPLLGEEEGDPGAVEVPPPEEELDQPPEQDPRGIAIRERITAEYFGQ
ncbi:hypothetical protein lerEdw1_020786 [Lerista edwardsae]|nr:hypothetical protein lerEdw1_020786 [Lerista edwardsae]